jgi:PAS domain S-box-containing protein
MDTDLFAYSASTIRDRDEEVLLNGRPLQYVLTLPGPDDDLHHLLVLKFLLAGEGGQTLLGVTAVDITEQQRAANLVARSEERYRLLFEDAPVAIHEIDREGKVTRINRAGCALCGFTCDEIVGRHASEFVIPQHRDESRAAVLAKLRGDRPLVPFERHYQHRDGRVLQVQVHETAIRDSAGNIQGLRSCLVDLTERYEVQQRLDHFALQLQENNAALALALESAREATRLKSQFLANMSHEIRTPMNGVLGMTELLMQSRLNEDQRALALSVSQSGEHLLALINDILDFSKIESGKFELESLPFDLPATVEAAVESMAPMAHAKGLELVYWIAPEVPVRVIGDSARLRQVLLNLLGNALKFTASGEIVLHVSAGPREGYLRVTVADTGIGIPESAIHNIFGAFTQADSTTSRRFGGTGLGLAIAKSIVELMEGEIGVERGLESGSTFWFTARLPAAGDNCPAPRRRLPAGRVLIVADSLSSRTILERYLTTWGVHATAVPGGPEVLALLRSQHFDAAVIDMRMSARKCTDFLAEIEAAGLPPIPILRMTPIGNVPIGDGCACSSVGPANTIRKPVRPEALFECLNRALSPDALLSGPSPDTAPRPPATPEPAPNSSSRGRILIAEDNAVNQRVALLQAKHCGFDADVVANGEEALDALARFHYALVLMDCQMPGLDGYAATRELRRRENGARHLPVIALTANAFATDRDACLQAGMDDHISKPVTLRNLAAILDRWSSPQETAPRQA